jgi:uncharacterized membrane protein
MANSGSPLKQRVESIDVLRGIVMVIMAIDHARDFFYLSPTSAESVTLDPTNPATTTPILFFTRWITHFCAPTFVFLSGISAYLVGQKRSIPELRSFLLKRGIWLIAVEFLIISLAWSFNPLYNLFFLQVIWAIGISMVLLGLLASLPAGVIMTIGAIILLGHNLLDLPAVSGTDQQNFLTDLFYSGTFDFYPYAPARGVLIVYAFLPWTGLMFLGYGFGRLYQAGSDPQQRKKMLVRAGLGITAFFILLRLANSYGDPQPWSVQSRGPIYTFLSFINTTKYPASLLFHCMTIGPALIFLAVLENYRNRVTEVFNQFGRVPMFYYIAHLYLLHLMAVVAFFASGYGVSDIITPGSPFFFLPPGFGFGLPGVYIAWAIAILILYPLCRWYNRYKATHSHWWLSYL